MKNGTQQKSEHFQGEVVVVVETWFFNARRSKNFDSESFVGVGVGCLREQGRDRERLENGQLAEGGSGGGAAGG
jgi:hypothetical protein